MIVQNLAFLTGEKRLAEALRERKNVEIRFSTVVTAYLGGETLTGVRLKNTETGTETELPVDGVFLAVGTEPDNAPYAVVAARDERGYLIADEGCTTRTPGVFAAGDVRDPRYRQAIVAAGSGCMAAMDCEKYLMLGGDI